MRLKYFHVIFCVGGGVEGHAEVKRVRGRPTPSGQCHEPVSSPARHNFWRHMKTNPNDFTVPVAGSTSSGLTKLEHFAVLLLQSRILTQDADEPITVDRVKLLAQLSVREASLLIDALNEHYERLDKAAATAPHMVDVRIAEILQGRKKQDEAEAQLAQMVEHARKAAVVHDVLTKEELLNENDLKFDDSSEDKS